MDAFDHSRTTAVQDSSRLLFDFLTLMNIRSGPCGPSSSCSPPSLSPSDTTCLHCQEKFSTRFSPTSTTTNPHFPTVLASVVPFGSHSPHNTFSIPCGSPWDIRHTTPTAIRTKTSLYSSHIVRAQVPTYVTSQSPDMCPSPRHLPRVSPLSPLTLGWRRTSW